MTPVAACDQDIGEFHPIAILQTGSTGERSTQIELILSTSC